MRLMRILMVLAVAAALVGCLDSETRIRLLPDGSGIYYEAVDIPQDLIDLVMDQRGITDINDFMALALIKADEELADVEGVRIIDAEAYCVERVCRMALVFSFDSIAQWNAYGGASQYPQLTLTTVEPPAKTRTEPTVRWTVAIKLTGRKLPGMEDGRMPGGQANMLDQENKGRVTFIVEGPREAAHDGFADPVEDAEIRRLDDGRVEFVGKMDLMSRTATLNARFAGLPVSAPELAKKRAALNPPPSPEYAKILTVIEKRKETERIKAAAQNAIAKTAFTMQLTLTDDDQVGLKQTRTFFGSTGKLMAEREALLHYLLPEANANYRFFLTRTAGRNLPSASVFTRERRLALPLSAFGDFINVRRDNDELVYSFAVGPLLAYGKPDPAPAQPLGKLVVAMPRAVTGTNGVKIDDRTVQMEFTADQLAGPSMLIVRIPAAK